jgi:wobble nucleotide-excising tRNase
LIKRITHVANFRCYQGWKEHPDAVDFQRLNLVYSPNGTGKSTLATLLSGVPEDPEWSHGMKSVIETDHEGSTREKVNSAGHWIWDNVRLFSADYVRRNLRFDAEDAVTGAPALMYLGETNIALKERRERAQRRIEALGPQIKDLEKRKRREERKREELCRDLGRRANKELFSANDRFSRAFNRSHVEKALEGSRTGLEDLDRCEEQDRALIHGPAWKPVGVTAQADPSIQDLHGRLTELLARTVTSEVIADLAADQAHSDWVRDGLALHGDRETCLFCESPVGEERRRRLERHFDESYTRLQGEIAGLEQEIGRLRQRFGALPSGLPAEEQLFEHLRERYGDAVKKVRSGVDDLQLGLDRFERVLAEKKGAMFTALAVPAEVETLTVGLGGLRGILEEHDRGTRTRDLDRSRAAEREFERMLYGIDEAWRDHRSHEESLADETKDLQDALAECQEALREAPPEGLDPHHFLSMLNSDIQRLLGHKELTFDHEDGHYRVMRDDGPARNLSEGEKTVIALLYFLQSLTERGRDLKQTIVVVDDPVSSLDDHLMFGVYSALVTRLEPGTLCRQLFVLTHSTQFLRHWSRDLLRGAPDVRRAHATLHFMKSVDHPDRDGSGRAARQPVLYPVDLESPIATILGGDYLLLFHRAAWDLLESAQGTCVSADIRLATSTPNDARRLLEYFLQFKAPKQATNLTAAVSQVLQKDPVRADRLMRFLHPRCHGTFGEGDGQVLDFRGREVISDVFALMREHDKDHFEGVCHRLGLTEHMDRLVSV